jgi:hypothetical protein
MLLGEPYSRAVLGALSIAAAEQLCRMPVFSSSLTTLYVRSIHV